MDISLTSAKQEKDIVQKIIEQATYSENLEKVKLELSQFEGKHFRHLNLEQLLKRVKDISIKFKKSKLINDYSVHDYENVTQDLNIFFDISDKIPNLLQYRDKIENMIARTELHSKLKKNNHCWLDSNTKTFYFTLRNGSVKPLTLWTERAQSDYTYLIFRLLYEHWLEFGEQVITKGTMQSKLNKLGWNDINDYKIKNYIKNLRDTKISPAQLSAFIIISYDRKLQGYKLKITYP